MSNDLTGCPGSQPKREGARDHVTWRVASPPSFSSSPRRFDPLLCSLPKFYLVVHYLSLLYVKMHFFFSSSFPPGKHAVLVQNGLRGTSLIGAWVLLNFWQKYKTCRMPLMHLLLQFDRFFFSSGRYLEGSLLQRPENK